MVVLNLRSFKNLSRFLFVAILLHTLATGAVTASATKDAGPSSYYEVLGVDKKASKTDIKKAYRTLALKHHPDRNRGNEKAAEILFRDLSEAYEVLSDADSRADYDRSLKRGGGGDFGSFRSRHQRSSNHRDPFAQFNDLFKNDDFFKEKFKGMDDMFDKMFDGAKPKPGGAAKKGGGGASFSFSSSFSSSSSSGGSGGNRRATTQTYSSGGGRGTHSSSRSTRTEYRNGQKVTVQSIKKDGNEIEERYIGKKLIERKVNGVSVPDARIGTGGEL